MCMWVFDGARLNFVRTTAFRTLSIWAFFLHCRVWSLGNQLLLQLSMNLFETLWACCGHNENVHVIMCMIFDGTRIRLLNLVVLGIFSS